jgi:hypothetical protein
LLGAKIRDAHGRQVAEECRRASVVMSHTVAALALGPRLGGNSPSLGTIEHDSERKTRS